MSTGIKRNLVRVGVSVALASQALAAQAAEQVMNKVSVTATRGPQELADIPATVSVLDAEQIERELAFDIRDLIRYEPGVSVSNAGTRFGLAGFNIRGIEGNRIAMRIDNVRVNDAFSIGSFSDARRNLVDLDMVKQAEIVRGPASALYGSDAIGGVVSFITKDPADFLRDDKRAYHRIKYGYQDDNQGWHLGWTTAFGDSNWGALLSYSRREGQETKNKGRNAAESNLRTAPNPQDRDSDAVLTKFTWNPNEAHSLRLAINYDRDRALTEVLSSQGRGSGAFANIVTVNLDGDDAQQRTRVSLDHTFNTETPAFQELEWRVYSQKTKVTQRSLEERYSFNTGPSSTLLRDRTFKFEQDVLGGEAVLRKTFAIASSEHLLTYGVDFVTTRTEQLRDGIQTTRATGAVTTTISPDAFPVRDFPNTDTQQWAAFAQDQIAFGETLMVAPGVRVDYYKLTPDLDAIFADDNPGVVVSGLKETSVSPKLGTIWTVSDAHSLYANYARGFRAPPYNDVNIGFTNLAFGYTAIANPDLKPETSNGYEVGVRSEYRTAFLSLAGFYNDYTDFINSLAFVGVQNGLQVFQSQNLAEARIYGAELRAGARIFDGVNVKLSVAYARGDGKNSGDAQRQTLQSVNPLKGVLGVEYKPTEAFGVELIATAVDRNSRINAASQFAPPGYAVFDLLAHAQFTEHLKFNLGVFNLTNKKYWEWSDVRGVSPTSSVADRFTQSGTTASAGVTVQF